MHKLAEAVPQYAKLMEDAYRFLWENPETGYKEWKGHAYLAEAFRNLGYELTEAGNIPGFYADLDTGKPGPMVLGELDALICTTHPESNPETGAVRYYGGKVEFMYRGYMDGVDVAFMIHTATTGPHSGTVIKGTNGWGTGCSDMGDVTMVMLAIHPSIGGAVTLKYTE